MKMGRRDLLRSAALASAAGLVEPLFARQVAPTPILDAHIHLFDPRRPGGIPWPKPDDAVIYKPALPERYVEITEGLGVVGAIAVEASPLLKDNDWVLAVAERNPVIVGFVGDLIPGVSGFEEQLDRLHANPLFLGIRYGNLWQRDLGNDSKKPAFLDGLRRLSSYGLELDSANPDPDLIRAILHVSDQIPQLRIVIDHVPSAPIPAAGPSRTEYWSNLHRLSQNSNVYIKLSEIPVRVGDRVPLDVAYYRDHLDQIWEVFGEDHILYGSDWPNSDHLATYAQTLALVQAYVGRKGPAVCRKFFWSNSISAYKWRPRRANQRLASA
jgi:predicted TIM-barrel fold metal-dependent hydrolase